LRHSFQVRSGSNDQVNESSAQAPHSRNGSQTGGNTWICFFEATIAAKTIPVPSSSSRSATVCPNMLEARNSAATTAAAVCVRAIY
jgi:hypothetical protein